MLLSRVNICYALLLAIAIISVTTLVDSKKLVRFVDVEHTNVTYYNTKYYQNVHITSQRKRRGDPQHYVTISVKIVQPLGKNVNADLYIYEFLSNEYRRSFVEVHGNVCDLLFKNSTVWRPVIRQYLHTDTCPLPANTYLFKDAYIPNLPLLATFPFQKGRAFLNVSLDNGEMLGSGHADFAIMTRFV